MSSDHNHSTNDPEQSHAGASHDRLPPARHRTRAAPLPVSETPASAPEADTAPYSIGYGKPPRHSQFKPGQSGNPRGRPKGAKGLRTMVRQTMTQKVAVRTGDGIKKMSRMEALLHKTHELAMKGNARALVQLYSLYAAAVPEEPTGETSVREDLTVTDLATLEALRLSLAEQPASLAPNDAPQEAEAVTPIAEANAVRDCLRDPLPQGGPTEDAAPFCSDWDRTP